MLAQETSEVSGPVSDKLFFSMVKAYCTNLFADGTQATIIVTQNPLPVTCSSEVQTGRL